MKQILTLLLSAVLVLSCTKLGGEKVSILTDNDIENVIETIKSKVPIDEHSRLERGVRQTAHFWSHDEGNKDDFLHFCTENFIAAPDTLEMVFVQLSKNFESIFGHFGKVYLDLNWKIHVDEGSALPIDLMFSSFDVTANFNKDFFNNKIAFYTILNFPFYSLDEKNKLGEHWTRKQWAYARMGDMFTSRVPAEVLQKVSEASATADNYISNYNIYVGYLVDDAGKTYFDKEKKLITHWNLRDELKSQYANPDGLKAQQLIYEVMNRIITQTIPADVINSNEFTWNPVTNKVYKNSKEVEATPEPNTRYQFLLDNYTARKAEDEFNPIFKTYIERKFDKEMEIPQKEVEELFIDLVSSATVKKVGELIKKRLGRDLKPFDIWYDGFKARSSITDDELSAMTKKKYPTKDAFAADLPNILTKLGFDKENANRISSLIEVDPSRGAGHAIGAQMKSEKAHLRTRVGADGMDYKGYNIAVHEFGHNVEQTITMQDMDYYMMSGVPNTAFTEAMAFLYQKRDLELLGIKDDNPNKESLLALDNFWASYEIMGVSLVDMNVWKWLYANPKANAEELKKATITIATEIWNKYYAPVFGVKDQPILAIYSHMIDYPLYLSAYPVGHLIELQLDSQFKGKNFADEMTRVLLAGRTTPELWMRHAVGKGISVNATINAAENALKNVTE